MTTKMIIISFLVSPFIGVLMYYADYIDPNELCKTAACYQYYSNNLTR